MMKSVKPLIAVDLMSIGISEEIISFTKHVGFDGIEYMMNLKDFLFKPNVVFNICKKYNLPIISLHQPLLLLLYTPPWLFNRMISISAKISTVQTVNSHLSGYMPIWQSEKNVLNYVQQASTLHVATTFESNPGRSFISRMFPKVSYDPVLFQGFCRQYRLPITLDVSHIASFNYDIVKFFSDNHKQIALIHLSDYRDGIEHLPLGEGKLPLKELLHEIKKTKWHGIITFEIFNFMKHPTREEKLDSLKKSLYFVRKYI